MDDVMAVPVMALGRDAPFKEIVPLVVDHRAVARLASIAHDGEQGRAGTWVCRRYDPGRMGEMQHRTVAELMTRQVVRARRDTPFKEIVRLLADNDVTAVPVVDDLDRPMGVVSEADLLRKSADRADSSGRTPIPHLEAWERAKAEGARAEELMSAPAVCAGPEWNVVEAARLMEVHNVKRLPVVDETDKLLGIVSRSDLLRVFLRKDDAIRDEISGDVLERTVGLAPSEVTAEVRQGQVSLRGTVAYRSLIAVIERLCQGVDGVVSVSNHLTYRADDTS